MEDNRLIKENVQLSSKPDKAMLHYISDAFQMNRFKVQIGNRPKMLKSHLVGIIRFFPEVPPVLKTAIWLKQRRKCLPTCFSKQSGSLFSCFWSGKFLTWQFGQIDHLFPEVKSFISEQDCSHFELFLILV